MTNSTRSISLQRIPDNIYNEIAQFLADEYHFLNGLENGGRMRLANYYVAIKKEMVSTFVDFIQEILTKVQDHTFPKMDLPEGFESSGNNLMQHEKSGSFSFGSFDMAVTKDTLQSIEFQAIATYPFTAAKVNTLLKNKLNLTDAYVFANDKNTTWEDFIGMYQTIMGGKGKETLVITDRNLKHQKTNFEFYATQKELGLPVKIVDIEAIFEKEQGLFYKSDTNEIQQIKRLYNRVLPNEAIYDDNYPNGKKWQLRYDKTYQDLTFINHPQRLFEVSKRLLPYLEHPFNPPALELKHVATAFLEGQLSYSDYVWKHKDGAAGFSLFLSPTEAILKQLIADKTLSDYIAQQKVNYHIFKTDDGLEKIIELRFMTAHTETDINIIPMARIGHIAKSDDGAVSYKIHFGDNNKLGYGFAPVLIFKD